MQFTLHAARPTPHGVSRLVQAMSASSMDVGMRGFMVIRLPTAVRDIKDTPRDVVCGVWTMSKYRPAESGSPILRRIYKTSGQLLEVDIYNLHNDSYMMRYVIWYINIKSERGNCWYIISISHTVIWYDMIWYDIIWYDMICLKCRLCRFSAVIAAC